MRVTRESLIRVAKETAQERAFNDMTIVAAYLTGSLISHKDPMLGGTADVDLVLVHGGPPLVTRQIIKLTADFHLDVRHRTRSEFRSPRDLRLDPFLGWEMYDPMLLYEREKFFEFVQAALRAGFEFNAPPLMLGRCRKLWAAARKGWADLSDVDGEKAGPLQVWQFLRALYDAANTVAELTGGPLPERRLLAEFLVRAQAAECPDFIAALFDLLGAGQADGAAVAAWIPEWEKAFLAAAQNAKVEPRINANRLNYYEKALQALLASETPLTALWPLLTTWTLSAGVLDESQRQPWSDACHQLGLLGPALGDHLSALDNYLDDIEVRLDEIAKANGLETSNSM
jgi:hypothetical protein